MTDTERLATALTEMSPDALEAFAATANLHYHEHQADRPDLAAGWRAILALAVAEHGRRERDEHLLIAEADFAAGGEDGEQVLPPGTPESG